MLRKRQPVFAANWKMHKTVQETRAFFASFLDVLNTYTDRKTIIAPPFTAIAAAREEIDAFKRQDVSIAAQNVFFEKKGAYTGEVSVPMLQELGVEFVILGHSERRHVFGETDMEVAFKVKAVLAAGLSPILCVGERLNEREAEKTNMVIAIQLAAALAALSENALNGLIIAYEPVWAIGTGKVASLEQIAEVHAFIRAWLADHFNSALAENIRILYGGSVKSNNAAQIMGIADVDGLLVGGASLDAAEFVKIVSCEI
ncbi:MAG: triose-phosphate isomerase [Dissulfuribacterales bacterium]